MIRNGYFGDSVYISKLIDLKVLYIQEIISVATSKNSGSWHKLYRARQHDLR